MKLPLVLLALVALFVREGKEQRAKFRGAPLGVFEAVETATVDRAAARMNGDVPLLPLAIEGDVSQVFTSLPREVLGIFGSRGQAEIQAPVVQAVSVAMIDLDANRSSEQKPVHVEAVLDAGRIEAVAHLVGEPAMLFEASQIREVNPRPSSLLAAYPEQQQPCGLPVSSPLDAVRAGDPDRTKSLAGFALATMRAAKAIAIGSLAPASAKRADPHTFRIVS